MLAGKGVGNAGSFNFGSTSDQPLQIGGGPGTVNGTVNAIVISPGQTAGAGADIQIVNARYPSILVVLVHTLRLLA